MLVHGRAGDAGLLGEHVHAEAARAALAGEAAGGVDDAGAGGPDELSAGGTHRAPPGLSASDVVGHRGSGGRLRRPTRHPRTADDELELAGEDLFEQFTASTGTPELQLGVVVGRKSDDNEVLTHKRVEILNPAPAAPVEAVGDPQQRGQLPQPGPVVRGERAEAGFGRLGVAAPVMAHERGEERDLGGLEAAQLAVLDEVGGVAVVALARHVLADVVQQRRELEHLAVAVAELVQLDGLVEQAAARAARRACVWATSELHRRARLATDARRSARGSSDQSLGIVAAHRVEHDALAQRPVAHGQPVELEQLERGRRAASSRRGGARRAAAPRARACAAARTSSPP